MNGEAIPTARRELAEVCIQEAVNRVIECWEQYCCDDLTWAELRQAVNEHLDECEREDCEVDDDL